MKTQYVKSYVQPLGLKFLVVLAIILSVTACSKDDSNDDTKTSTGIMAKLTDGVWYLESESQSNTDQCAKYTAYQFNQDNTLEVSVYYEDGLGACQFSHVGNFTFELHSDTDKITTTQVPNGTPRDYVILELTIDKLVLQDATYIPSSGDANIITFDRSEG